MYMPSLRISALVRAKKILATSYSPRENPSTIGAKELNYCVRNGNRWDLLAIVTRNYLTK